MSDTIAKQFREHCKRNPELTMLLSKGADGEFAGINAEGFYSLGKDLGCGLISLGVGRGEHVGIVSDNRKEWIIADLAILSIGAADVPRGCDSTAEEIKYILSHAECRFAFVENQGQLAKVLGLRKDLPQLKTLIVMDAEHRAEPQDREGVRVLTFATVLAAGRDFDAANPGRFEREVEAGGSADLATIIYTSGTTGEPKGVLLTHANYLHQYKAPLQALDIRRGDIFLSVLPIWHSYERALEYVAFLAGCAIAYSKPVGSVILEDMAKVRPMIFPSVPRIWEGVRAAVYRNASKEGGLKKALFLFFVAVGKGHAGLRVLYRGLRPRFRRGSRLLDAALAILPMLLLSPINALGQLLVFSKLRARLGGRFRFGVSGGGALPKHVDDFFAAAGILLLEGYGLTESSPIVSVRSSSKPVPGTIGVPVPEVEVRVVNDEGKVVGPGEKGVLHVKGPNVMMGYHKRPDLTARVILPDGWLDTGDLAILTYDGEIKIIGRQKDTIVLLGGENIEPAPIEETILGSEYIQQVMVVGQDKRFLGAIVVPNFDAIAEFAKANGIVENGPKTLIERPEIVEHIRSEIDARVNLKTGFKPFERVFRVLLLDRPFEVGREMSLKMELKRGVIAEGFRKQIDKLLA
jgi:long-chain acyl-CoA synthetase